MAKTALYRFFDKDGKLLYVGITERFGQRWGDHAKQKHWWPEVAKAEAEWHETREAAASAEIAAIKAEEPRYNVVHSVERKGRVVKVLRGPRPNGSALGHLRDCSETYERTRAERESARAAVNEVIIEALESGATPTEVNKLSPFTPAYVRRIAKEAGVAPRPKGPKKTS